MHTVDVLREACAAARKLGFEIRQEWLEGTGGGVCEFGGKRWIFIDLSQPAPEQLEQVLSALRAEPPPAAMPLSPVLRRLCQRRRAA